MNSIFGIKNTEFNTGFKKMTKLVRLARCQWPSFTTLAIDFKKLPMAGVVNDGH